MPLRFAVLFGSVRSDRQGIRAARFVVEQLRRRGNEPGLKNLLDHFLEEYFWRPSAIVCYSAGAYGGVRAAMQLRMTLAELGMPSIPSLFPVPQVQDAFDASGRANK